MRMKPIDNSARRQNSLDAARNAGPLPSEARTLAEQLGSLQPLAPLEEAMAALCLGGVKGLPDLNLFLQSYDHHILQSFEFPIIARAFQHASRGETRELIALDLQLNQVPALAMFAEASQRIGRLQLKKLRPLKDLRLVQRYLAALDAGQAFAWHPLVYGLTLAVFSLPLRQGLLRYGEETLSGLAFAAARSRGFREAACREMLEPLFLGLPKAIEAQEACQPAPWQKSG